jgi:anti-sigma regulatory factor (Ser/Thr protein kinase)
VATQFPHPTPFDLAAAMDPAREVGGDFFDFFLTDDRTLFVAVGDVSGKGVPAALFMMTVKTSLKAEAMGGLAPVEVLRRVNRNIQAGNTAGMFVTILCASVDLVTGHARFGNAGHCPPLARLGTAPFRFVDVPPSPVLGLQPNQTFSAGSLTLHCGDALFLYTDGVTEATDPRGDFYGDERLLAQLQRGPAERMSDLTAAVRNDIRAFAGQAQQSDDVTLLAVRYGGSGTAEVTQAGASPTAARPERGTAGPTTCLAECRMAARRENSPAFLAVAAACAQRCGLTPERIAAVELAVEEVLAVLVRHVSGATGDIALRCGADAARLYFEFVAHGMPLGVLAKPDPTQPASPASRECDGLELPLTMQATAELRCHRQGDCDRLILGVDR